MKVLAILGVAEGATQDQIAPHLLPEAQITWDLYAADSLRELYLRGDQTGAVVVLEATDAAEAARILEKLPLVELGFLEYQLIPLQPFVAFAGLFADTKK